MHETQESITQWASETFGASRSLYRLINRAAEELIELQTAAELTPEKGPEEAADTMIVLARVARRLNVELIFDEAQLKNTHTEAHALTHIGAALVATGYLSVFASRFEHEQDPSMDIDSLETLSATQIHTVVMRLAAYCRQAGTTLESEIDKKMAANRHRTWNLQGDGTGYHAGA